MSRFPPISNLDSTTFSQYYSRGTALATLSGDNCYFWEDFLVSATGAAAPNYFGAGIVGTGSYDPITTRGGVGRLKSGATAASQYNIYSNASFLTNSQSGSEKWYVASRFKINTATDAVSVIGCGLTVNTATASVVVGFAGALDAVNFIVQFDGNFGAGTALSFAVAKDTAYHVFEMYCIGDSKVRARIDKGAEVSATMVNNIASPIMAMICRNGTTAADRQMDLDWYMAISARS